jgi:hypothetical protein
VCRSAAAMAVQPSGPVAQPLPIPPAQSPTLDRIPALGFARDGIRPSQSHSRLLSGPYPNGLQPGYLQAEGELARAGLQ